MMLVDTRHQANMEARMTRYTSVRIGIANAICKDLFLVLTPPSL
jgi:hypothetical protein